MREFGIKMGFAMIAYVSPLYEMFVVMMFFVLADLITGITASHKRQIPRSSRRLRKSITKLACYLTAMMLAYAAENAFQIEWFVAHRAIGAFICAVEFISILENFAVVTGNPIFLRIVKWIRGRASNSGNLINEIINEKNELSDRNFYDSADLGMPRPKDTTKPVDDSERQYGDNTHRNNTGYGN